MPPAAVLAWLSLAASVLLPLGNSAIAGTPISSARVWPAAEYTRLTLESASPIQYSLSTVKNPDRVVVDLERVALTRNLKDFPPRLTLPIPIYRQCASAGTSQAWCGWYWTSKPPSCPKHSSSNP